MTPDDYVRLPAMQYRALLEQLAAANERAGRLNRQLVELQDVIDDRDKAAGFEEVSALSPETRQTFRAVVQEIDGVNLRRVKTLEAELARLREAAEKVTCMTCEGTLVNRGWPRHNVPCYACADLRRLLEGTP